MLTLYFEQYEIMFGWLYSRTICTYTPNSAITAKADIVKLSEVLRGVYIIIFPILSIIVL